MAGFRKAKAEQAAIKIAIYGPSGSGKSLTSLLCSEGLAALTKKRIAYIDTEHGTDFYCQEIPERKVHPKGFDFDAIYTRSITEALSEIKNIDMNTYGILVIDSITHLWESAKLAYTGKLTSKGGIPFHGWGKIKKPYKEIINIAMSSPMHVIICGRQGNEFEEDEDGELKCIGTKMKAEGETPYEPNILIHMESIKDPKSGVATVTAFAEKDRTGILAGRTILNPTFQSLIAPILPHLGNKQAEIKPDHITAAVDAEILTEQDAAKEKESATLLEKLSARIVICETPDQLKVIQKEITPELKARMTTNHVAQLRDKYLEAERMIGK